MQLAISKWKLCIVCIAAGLLFPAALLAQQPRLMLPIGHTDQVWYAAYSPDGKKIATASYDGTAKIWDAYDGKLIADLKGHTSYVSGARFSPDNKELITASLDSFAIVWDAVTGNLLFKLEGHHKEVYTALFSNDGKRMLTASYDGTAKIWNAENGKLLIDLKGHKGPVQDAVFDNTGKYIATGSFDSTAIIWNVSDGKALFVLGGHTGTIYSVAFSSDGKMLVTASEDSTAKIWDVASGKLLFTLKGHTNKVFSAQFSRDSRQVITASFDKTARIWSTSDGQLVKELKGHAAIIWSAVFSADGKTVLTTSSDRTAKIWDTSTGLLLKNLKGHKATIWQGQFSPDGKRVITASKDKTARVWNAGSGKLLMELKGQSSGLWSARFNKDDRKIVTVSGDNIIRIWDVAKANVVINFIGHTDTVRTARFNPDGTKLVTASDDKTAKVWNVSNGNMLFELKKHAKRVTAALFSSDGKKIVTASDDAIARIWDAENGVFLRELNEHTLPISFVQFSSDNKLLVTASMDGTAKVWSVETGELITTFSGHSGAVLSASFSPDSKRVISTSFDSTAKIWEAATGKLLQTLRGHTDVVSFAQFNADGTKAVTASGDNTARIWDVVTGIFLFILKGHAFNIRSAQFTKEGDRIITSSRDNTARIWDVVTGRQLAILGDHVGDVESCSFSNDEKMIMTGAGNTTVTIWDAATDKKLYSFFAIEGGDYLVVDEKGRYDGTEAAIRMLYFTCGDEVIGLDQVKDSLWVPNLAERIMKGEIINAPSVSDLGICGLAPVIEDQTGTGDYQFKITPRKGGLGETVLLVNGIEVERFQPAQLLKKGKEYVLTVNKEKLRHLMVPGENNPVTLKAYTAGNGISSRGAIVGVNEEVNYGNAVPPDLYAVMVGVGDYKGTGLDLKYAAKDAEDLSVAVGAAARKLLNIDNKEHVFIYNATTGVNRTQFPDKQNVKKIFDAIGKKATAKDIILVFFAGHGVMEGKKKQFYFLTADASPDADFMQTGISIAELTDWMKPSAIKAQKRVLIFDACNSGQAINDILKIGDDNTDNLATKRNDDLGKEVKAIEKLNERSGMFILSASASNQSAYEMSKYEQGLLTYALLKVIREQPNILEDGKYLNVDAWFRAAEKKVTAIVSETGTRQDPQKYGLGDFNIGMVDSNVLSMIRMPDEKPLFAGSSFQNSDINVADDDLELSKYVNQQLNEIASRGITGDINYATATSSPDAWSLTGNYDVMGEEVLVRVNVKQHKNQKHRFEKKGNKADLETLAKNIVEEVTAWIAKQK